MPDTPPSEPFKSTLPELKLPADGWKSSIPEHLLIDADPQMVWLMHEVSKNTAATEFACRAAVTHNDHLRMLNGKTYKTEQVAEVLKSDVTVLKDQATSVSPFLKVLTYFSYLWDYKWFRWTFTLGLLAVAGVAYPWYLSGPWVVIKAILSHMLGGE